MTEPTRDAWYKSSRSDAGKQCVEVCHAENAVGVRDSKQPGGPELWFTPEQWESFIGSGIWQG
ncbi:Domain of uncharacterised function (DUF397) [Nocardia otitidiscaviarum]|uniref:Domain of uncharacterized function (DUF397) n=1 Tax=Nocardia otitidiscaviarum TaxID=1823 RepID=A0A378YE74_9NOCA|nr:DUF397 domain-containing protein [Nocardia otitidiscaviarum]MBF6238072.1 DUF397 domain-containing protein [Nocardia otitidiscaviarum]SUA75003.1 Domain of uncharacterised function (DUF397) [Nocardia otitidiscaviarum]